LGDVFDVTHLGGQNLKGIAGQPLAYGVIGVRVVESRFEARASGAMSNMVGRDHELALMLERWKQAKAGEGQLVLLSGEAGIGCSCRPRTSFSSGGRAQRCGVCGPGSSKLQNGFTATYWR
jgi:hypothetical protein